MSTRVLIPLVYVGGLIANLRMASEFRDQAHPATMGLVSLGETVERAALRIRFLAQQKHVGFEVAVPDRAVMVRGDPIGIEQAIVNVVENAVTHNVPDGHVAVLLEQEGSAFQLTVADDGPGVAPSELPHLGERTFRSDAARQRDPRGRGLGLAITGEVCRRLGWQLTFAAGEPTGLRVAIRGTSVPTEEAG